jgi:ubiquinol-cytochrome c reductase cytochrome c1 subunit
VKAIAKGFQVPGIDPATGEVNTRPGTPTDYFPKPFANDVAARAANNNAIPPDLSLMTKARHDGAAYVYSLLTGYQNPPADLLKRTVRTPRRGPALQPLLRQPQPRHGAAADREGQVTYSDGTKATVDQMAKDVSAFLVWTAEPKLEKRNQTGWPVLGFLLFATILGFLSFKDCLGEKKKKKA